MNLETYCLKDYGGCQTLVTDKEELLFYLKNVSSVLKVQVRGMERSGPWWQFSIAVQTVFREGSASRVRKGPHSLWVPDRDLRCGCPALHVGRTFLLIGTVEGERAWGPEESRLVADRSTLALQWREHWGHKLRGFRGQDKRGRCPAEPQSGLPQTRPEPGYVPPHLLAETDAQDEATELPPARGPGGATT